MVMDEDRVKVQGQRVLYRSITHLGLIVSAVGALATLQFLHIRIAIHADVGLVFMALVVIHLVQRRETIRRMLSKLSHLRWFADAKNYLAGSDALLGFVALNVLVSGVVDWNQGQPTQLPLLPGPFGRWHTLSSVILVAYLTSHVWHRRKRLRRSRIR